MFVDSRGDLRLPGIASLVLVLDCLCIKEYGIFGICAHIHVNVPSRNLSYFQNLAPCLGAERQVRERRSARSLAKPLLPGDSPNNNDHHHDNSDNDDVDVDSVEGVDVHCPCALAR